MAVSIAPERLELKGNSEKDNKLTQVILLKTKIIIRSSSHEMGGLVANILKMYW